MKSKRIKIISIAIYSIQLLFLNNLGKAQLPKIKYEMSLKQGPTYQVFSSYLIEFINDSTLRFSEIFHLSHNKTQLISKSFIIYDNWNKLFIYTDSIDTCLNINSSHKFNTHSNFESITHKYNTVFKTSIFSSKISIGICAKSSSCGKVIKRIKKKEFTPFLIPYIDSNGFRSHSQTVKFDLVFTDPLFLEKIKNFPIVLGVSFLVPETFYFTP